MSKREIHEFYRRLAETRPIPQTELEFINPFTLLIAVVLSAQATDVGVNKATAPLFALADTPEKMLALGEERLIEMIRTIGLFRTKAKNVLALSRLLVDRHNGEVPRDRAALESPTRGRPQNRERRAQRRLWRADDCRRYAYLSRRQPHRLGGWENPARGRAGARKAHPTRIQKIRASLVDPARALCLQGAQARLPDLRRRRSLPLPRENRPGRVDRSACECG